MSKEEIEKISKEILMEIVQVLKDAKAKGITFDKLIEMFESQIEKARDKEEEDEW